MAAPLILVEAQPRRASDGEPVTFRFAGGGGERPYYYEGEHWKSGIVDLPTMIASIDFDERSYGTGGVATATSIEWAPGSAAALAEAANHVWSDAAITVRIGPEDGSTPPIALTGKVLQVSVRAGRLQIALADPAVDLKKPFLSDRFAGTGDLEGPVEFEGRLKRRVFGRVWNVPALPLDPPNNIYCFADPKRPLNAFTAVRDKGVATDDLVELGWQGSAAATLAALRAAEAPPGGGIACPSIACVRWWSQPKGDLTADIRGEVGSGYAETTADLVERIVLAAGGPAFAAGTIAAARVARPDPVGWLVEEESDTTSGMLDQLLGDVSLLWVLAPTGEIVIREWSWGEPVRTVRATSIERSKTYRPIAAHSTGYLRNELPMPRNSLAAIVLLDDLEVAPEELLNSEQEWEQIKDGAGTRPEDNATQGSPPNTYVGGVLSQDLAGTVSASALALANIAADGQLTPDEKKTLVARKDEIDRTYAAYQARAASYGAATAVGVALTAATNAKNAWQTYLNGLTPAWNATSTTTPVARATFNAKLNDYRQALDVLLAELVDEARKEADWGGVTGRPTNLWELDFGASTKLAGIQSEATRNNITRSSTPPSGASEGDTWIDLSVSPIVIRVRINDAWEVAGTAVTSTSDIVDGAGLGTKAAWTGVTGRPSSLPDLDSTRASKLDGIEAQANRTLNTNQLTDGAGLGTTAVWGNVGGRPLNLAQLDSTANTKLSGIQAGAQVNPANLAALDATANTKLSGIEIGATKNTVTRAATAPASPTNGDIWVDTSVSPNVTKTRIANAWQSSANLVTNTSELADGAGLGTKASWTGVTGRPTTLSGLNSTEGSKLAGIQAGAQVNPANLAALDATASTKLAGIQAGAQVNPANLAALDSAANTKLDGIEAQANRTLNTNQLTDGAGLGTTAVWANVGGRPLNLTDLDSTRATKLDGVQAGAQVNPVDLEALDLDAFEKLDGIEAQANRTLNTNQLTDGAGLGTTAVWGNVGGRPLNLAQLDSTANTKLSGIQAGAQVNPANLAALDATANTKLSGIEIGATKNTVTRAATAPASPTNGDIWVDTSVSPNVTKTRIANAWQSSANLVTNTSELADGAGLGTKASWTGVTGRPTSLPDLDSTRATKLDGIEAQANRTLNTNQLTDGAGLGTKAAWTGVTGRPTSLSGLNSTEGSKLAGIQAGAQVNPANLAALDSAANTKLAGIQAGAQVNPANLQALDNGMYNRLVTAINAAGDLARPLIPSIKADITADQISDGTTYKRFQSTERNKLSGIAEGATRNEQGQNLIGDPVLLSAAVAHSPASLNTGVQGYSARDFKRALFGGFGGYFFPAGDGPVIPVVSGEKLFVSYAAYFSTTTATVVAIMRFYPTGSGSYVEVLVDGDGLPLTGPGGTGYWRNSGVGTVTVPPDMAYCSLYLFSGGSGGGTYAGDFYIGRAQSGADVTTDQPVVKNLNPTTGRGDGRLLSANLNYSARSFIVAPSITFSPNGAMMDVIATGGRFEAPWGGIYALPDTTFYSKLPLTTYYLVRNVANPQSGGDSYDLVSDPNLVNGPDRVWVKTMTTPAQGFSTGGSANGGSGAIQIPGKQTP